MNYMAENKLENIRRINKLWEPVYPFLASAIMDNFGKHTGRVLEIGPFSGGLSMELAKLYANLDITIATWESDETKYMENEVADLGFEDRIEVVQTGRDEFNFADEYFDLIICRGALFFLDEKLLLGSYRILAKNGLAYIGGGYGKNTPQYIIDTIHYESHVLNQNLGKRWVTKDKLEKLLRDISLTNYCRIEEEGGLWLLIRK
jgi:ubiquinone/menaquinone biosynthesis C-methylase UbiE